MTRLALDHELGVLARDAVVEEADVRLLAAADDRLVALELVHLADAGAGEHHQVGAVPLDAPRRRGRHGDLRALVDGQSDFPPVAMVPRRLTWSLERRARG